MDYYDQQQLIARVNKQGEILGPIDKWEAHKQGVLHLAFTVTLKIQDQYILQHRKHPAFDGVFDITTSSHQLFINDILQNSVEAVYDALLREWEIKKSEIPTPTQRGRIYYKSKDPFSEFTEHELCEVFEVELDELPVPNFEYAYGFSLASKAQLQQTNSALFTSLAPWSQKMIQDNLL